MQGMEKELARRIDDTHPFSQASMAGKEEEREAQITEQVPRRRRDAAAAGGRVGARWGRRAS